MWAPDIYEGSPTLHCFYNLRITGRHGPKKRIPPLAGFCSKFYLFFAALGCGAYFLAPVGVVTSIIGHWTARRLPRCDDWLFTD
ncbi:NADH dehydrogenase, putative [Ricinus communis]|uniref:NADH dehydrogenase, putative n=1 Tax=Ricinus communis TaxID=3988 RepID=B9T745_RICCO|nr:NADH dehydrogenase, putative [Ricinus communis]